MSGCVTGQSSADVSVLVLPLFSTTRARPVQKSGSDPFQVDPPSPKLRRIGLT